MCFFIRQKKEISSCYGMNFKACFLSVYGVWISDKGWMKFEACFLSVYGVWISDKGWVNFEVCFLYIYRVWISDKGWVNFEACFLYVYGVWISDKEWMKFEFFICLQVMNFWQRVGEFHGMFLSVCGVWVGPLTLITCMQHAGNSMTSETSPGLLYTFFMPTYFTQVFLMNPHLYPWSWSHRSMLRYIYITQDVVC